MEINRKQKIKCALSGAFSGLINGFFGGGGGMALVPLLTGWIGLEEKKAFATSVAVMLPLCSVSACVYFFRAGIALSDALPFLIGGLLGGIIGGLSFKKVSDTFLRRVFALFVIYGGIKSLL